MLSRRDALTLPALALLSAESSLRFTAAAEESDPTRIFLGGKKPTDERLGAAKTLNDFFPFVVPKTKEAWEVRRKAVREQLLVATGLWPLPEKAPLTPAIHSPIQRVGYTIEKVSFASTPGHYVCGNLYRPTPLPGSDAAAKRPGVLFAHGHWANGRFHDAGEKAAKASIDAGGEPDMDRGRYFMQALPATLARLGFVVFHYDMVGVADSTAIGHGSGFADAAAELRLQSAMGLQTWNSIRALDFLAGLPDVDATRLGMTGASGGGTQTFILAAIDDRLACAFPAVMVSTGMQGGCVCENCSLLRVKTGNVEIAGLFAPKPLAMSAANDWTREMTKKGFPELQQLYSLYEAKEKVTIKAWLEYGHQYNVHAREFMYSWFLKHLQAKDEAPREPAFKPVTPPDGLSVFDDKHPRPKDELDAKSLRVALARASDEQMGKLIPKDAESLKRFQHIIGTALRAAITSTLPSEIALRGERLESKVDELILHRATIGRIEEKDAVPTAGLFGARFKGDKLVVWLHPKGKTSLLENGKPTPAVKTLMDAGYGVLAPDLLGVGENALPGGWPVDRRFAGYTYGYNRTLLANRVHDALTAVALGKSSVKAKTVHMVGWDEFGPIAVLAKALAGEAVARTAADLNRFRFEDIDKSDDPMMLPGAVKYGGLGAFLALCAPGEVLVHNQMGRGTGQLSRAAYEAAAAANKLTRNSAKLHPAKVVEWLVAY